MVSLAPQNPVSPIAVILLFVSYPLPIVLIADHSEPLQDPSTAIPSSFQGSLSPASKMVATPLRFMQRVTGSSEIERLREINSKMQRCLEEALMKNISLQEVCGIAI